MALVARTFEQLHEVDGRLHQMGLTQRHLSNAVAKGVSARLRCTPFHPRGVPGLTQWFETVVGLREELVPVGWEPDDSKLALILNPIAKIGIGVSGGTSRTGRPGGPAPLTRHPRGAMTRAAIFQNQMSLDLFGPVVAPPDDSISTWILLIYAQRGTVSVELSLPAGTDRAGHVNSWAERILLPDLSIDPDIALTDEADELAPIDIPVQRR